MHGTRKSVVNTANPALLAFRPRQVLLAKKGMKQSEANGSAGKAGKAMSLDSDHKSLLLNSVARFLEVNGFSKTLKKFLSEAQIEIDASKGAMLDLEELCMKHIEKCDDTKKKFMGGKEQDKQVFGDKAQMLEQQAKELGKNGKEKTKKKKKNNLISESEALTGETAEKSKDVYEEEKNFTDFEVHEKKTKDKEKKKKKTASFTDNVESRAVNSVLLDSSDNPGEEKSAKCRTKKRKKDDSEDANLTSNRRDDSQMSDAEAAGQDNKDSKKRKRKVSDDNDLKPADTRAAEESKRRKIVGMKFSKESEQQPHSNPSLGSDKIDELQSNSIHQLNGLENGSIDKSIEKSSARKTTMKQFNDSAEPKTLNPFQRVKVAEVVFSDERLKNNSYWAKDGAETGYGAKAEEVLGQVRGRDFRHEKTKKKRGSYRGGQIDLQSHSVKFNYSDDE